MMMQTFLPYPCFEESARCLDYRRLGKQRVEAMQLINTTIALQDNPNAKIGWRNHPARLMWVGYLDALKIYHDICILEWIRRGYVNNMKLYNDVIKWGNGLPFIECEMPWWIGNERFHASHRSNLLRKNAEWYGKFGWNEPDDLEYYWPVEGVNHESTI